MPTVEGLPGVFDGRRLVAGEDVVEPAQGVLVERHAERSQRALELLHRAGADDRRGDAGLLQQPRDPDVGRALPELAAETLVLLQGRPVVLEVLLGPALVATTALARLLQRAGEQAAVQRAPRDDSHAVVLRRRQHL